MRYAICVLLTLGACTEGPFLTWEPETVEEREMRESIARMNATVGEGALLGAAGGALLGAIFSDSPSGLLQGARIGRLSGATAGLYVREKQSEFAQEEAALNAIVADLDAANARLAESIVAMEALLGEQRAMLAAEAAQDRTRARATRNAAEMKRAVAVADGQEGFFSTARSVVAETGPADAMDPGLLLLRSQIARMRQISEDLSSAL